MRIVVVDELTYYIGHDVMAIVDGEYTTVGALIPMDDDVYAPTHVYPTTPMVSAWWEDVMTHTPRMRVLHDAHMYRDAHARPARKPKATH